MYIYLNGKEISEEKKNRLQKLVREKAYSKNPDGLTPNDRIYFIHNPGSTTDGNGDESVCIEIKLAKGEEEIKATTIERLFKSKIGLKKGVGLEIITTHV